MGSFWHSFRFSFAREKEFQEWSVPLETCFVHYVMVGLLYLGFSVCTWLQWGLGLHNLLLLAAPICSISLTLALLRWKTRIDPWGARITALIGFATLPASLYLLVPLQARDIETALTFGGVATPGSEGLHNVLNVATSMAAWPHVLVVALHLQLLGFYPYDTALLMMHLSFPAALLLPMLLSPAVAYKTPLVIAVATVALASLWQSVWRTLGLRRRFMAHVADLQAVEGAEDRAVEVSRAADYMMNHRVKNALVDARALLDTFLEDPAGSVTPVVSQAWDCLQIGIEWCSRRLLLLRVLGAEYIPAFAAVCLEQFVRDVARGHDVRVMAVVDATVRLDSEICGFVVDAALSNAVKHGHPTTPDVALSAHVQSPGSEDSLMTRGRVVFSVTHRADPAKPRIAVERGSGAAGDAPDAASQAGPDGTWLTHIDMAAEAIGMTVSLTQNAGTVTFTAAVETDIVDPDIEEEAEVPAGLKMCCIDDSGVARRLVTSQFLRFFPGSEAQAFGRSREDVPAFVEAVLSGADVVVLDQNLEWSREEVVLGTDLLQELLAKGFQGLLCMRSANSAEADVKFYRR